MILIAGVQPRTKTVDATPRRCPACGLHQARIKRVDHYFSLFFLPVFRVRKGEEALVCDRCQGPVPDGRADGPSQDVCSGCGQRLDASFRYCPHCGRKR